MARRFLSVGHKSSGKTTIASGLAARLSADRAMLEDAERAEAPWFESLVAFIQEGVAAHGPYAISQGPTARAQRRSPRTPDDLDA